MMKKIGTILAFIFIAGLATTGLQSCDSKKSTDTKETVVNSTNETTDSSVKAYYFHATRRCVTCEAVEKVAKETIAENYKGKVVFESINREEESDNPLVVDNEISGQTLLLVKGQQKVDVTSAAFMYARNNPEKFEEKLKSAIDSML